MKTIDGMNEEYLDKIISVAYGDANFVDEIRIYLDARKNPEVKKLLDEYRETARGVSSISQEEYSGKIPIGRPGMNNLLLQYFNIFIRKPALSAAMALMITAGVTGYFIIEHNDNYINGYSKSEVVTAEQQARESFAIVASIMNKTRKRIEKNVFTEKINKPIKESLTVVNTYL